MSQPTIKIEKTENLPDACHLILSCKGEQQNVTYTWFDDLGSLPQNGEGGVLERIITPQNKSTFYTCQVSNPISRKNDTVYFTLPCTLGKNYLPGSWGGHMMTGFFWMKKDVGFLLGLLAETVVGSLKGVIGVWDLASTWLYSHLPASSPYPSLKLSPE